MVGMDQQYITATSVRIDIFYTVGLRSQNRIASLRRDCRTISLQSECHINLCDTWLLFPCPCIVRNKVKFHIPRQFYERFWCSDIIAIEIFGSSATLAFD